MKLLLGLIVTFLAIVASADRPSVPLKAMDWSTQSYVSLGQIYPVATSNDLLVYYDVSAAGPINDKRSTQMSSSSPVMAVRRRNSEGVYEPVGNFTDFVTPFVTTNGKWVAVFGMGNALFSVDENNNITNISYINEAVNSGFLLSDDTFVGYVVYSPTDDGNYTINTYQYESSNNTWNEIAGTELVFPYPLNVPLVFTPSYYVSDTHLVLVDASNTSDYHVNIFERQANKSWSFIESVPVNSSEGVNYNGVDTITCFVTPSEGEPEGILFIYTKSNGKWSEQKFTATDVGFRPLGYLGAVTTFLDANTMLVSAPYEGVTQSNSVPTGGKILLMTRDNSGVWMAAADLSGSGLFANGMGVNDVDIVASSYVVGSGNSELTFYTAPRCFYQPINVTCNNIQANECSGIEISSLYSINNAQCGDVEATLGEFSLINNNAIQAQLSFSRAYGASVSCNVTVTCPSAPTFVQQQTPTGKAVSSAVGFELGLSLLVSAVAMFL